MHLPAIFLRRILRSNYRPATDLPGFHEYASMRPAICPLPLVASPFLFVRPLLYRCAKPPHYSPPPPRFPEMPTPAVCAIPAGVATRGRQGRANDEFQRRISRLQRRNPGEARRLGQLDRFHDSPRQAEPRHAFRGHHPDIARRSIDLGGQSFDLVFRL